MLRPLREAQHDQTANVVFQNWFKDRRTDRQTQLRRKQVTEQQKLRTSCASSFWGTQAHKSEHSNLQYSAGPCWHGYNGTIDDMASTTGTSGWTHVDARWVPRSKVNPPQKGVIRPHQRRRHLFKQLADRPRDQRPLGSLVSSRSTCRSPSRLPQLLPSLPPPVRRRHVHLHRKASIPCHYGLFQKGVLITSGCRLHELSVFGTPCGTFIPLNQGCQQSFGHGTGTQGAASTTEAQSA